MTEQHELIVIGGGPAGLTAALTAEAHGIDTLVIDCSKLGGQAATATLIENYPGFPDGISGEQLVNNIVDQALKFSTEFQAPSRVTSVHSRPEGIVAQTEDGQEYLGKVALLSVGQEQRLLPVRNLAAYNGRGVHYGSPVRIVGYENKQLFVIGGSDAAAQAAVHLSQFPDCQVHMIVRGDGLEKRASKHLIDKVTTHPNIHIHAHAELSSVDGDGHLRTLTIETDQGKQELSADELFILIGSEPRTSWLAETILRDKKGYLLAGSDLPPETRQQFTEESGGRLPYNHETSMPGLFVAGDVRSGAGKWVTLAVFDGAAVVPEIQSLEIHNRLHPRSS